MYRENTGTLNPVVWTWEETWEQHIWLTKPAGVSPELYKYFVLKRVEVNTSLNIPVL